jgi:hypothetical protein
LRNKPAALFLLLAAALAAPAAATVDLFPRPNEIFPVLIADPRHIQLSASYYRLDGRDTSDLALGHAWGLTRWRSGMNQDWLWETDLEAMGTSRFALGGGVNEFETVDFFAAMPVTVRRGDASFKGTLFHESSHLGDDYIRRTGDAGFRYSTEGLRAQAALEPCPFARAYAGASYLLHTVPAPERWSLQSGLEASTRDLLGWSKNVPLNLFLAEDLQWHERLRWNMDSHTVAGVKIRFRESPTRAMRVQAGYFIGHSPYGEFFARRTHYADLSVSFEL